jgi:hypothetical protein
VLSRYVSQSRPVTDDDVATFHSFLDSHPSEEQLKAFQKTSHYKDVVKHLKEEGATEGDIDAMVLPAIEDPNMVFQACYVHLESKRLQPCRMEVISIHHQ